LPHSVTIRSLRSPRPRRSQIKVASPLSSVILSHVRETARTARVLAPLRKLVPVRPLINSTRFIDTFDRSVCHDEPRATSDQYPKRPIHRCHPRDRRLYAILPQCSATNSAYLDEFFTWKFKFELNDGCLGILPPSRPGHIKWQIWRHYRPT